MSFNKSVGWHIDGVTRIFPTRFLFSTNLQTTRVEIWQQSDYWFVSYSILCEATFVIENKNGKRWIASFNKALLFDEKKYSGNETMAW